MSEEQNVDFLEVLHDTVGSLMGRLISMVIAFFLGSVLVAATAPSDYYDFSETLGLLYAAILFSLLSPKIVLLPVFFLFAIGFVKYEWPLWALLIPFGAPWLYTNVII